MTEPLGPPGPPIPDELRALIDRVTDKRPEIRPAALELAQALEEVAARPAGDEAASHQAAVAAAPTVPRPEGTPSPEAAPPPDPPGPPASRTAPGADGGAGATDRRALVTAGAVVLAAIVAIVAFAVSRDGSSVAVDAGPTPVVESATAPTPRATTDPTPPDEPTQTAVATSAAETVSSTQLQRILDRGEIVIGLQPRFVPSAAQPFHRAVGQELADRLGVEARFVDPGLDSTTFVASGQADVVMNKIAVTDADSTIGFAGAYALDGITIVPPRGSGITNHRIFDGRRIGVIDGPTADFLAENLGSFGLADAELIRFPAQADTDELTSSDAGSALLDQLVADGELDARIGSNLEGDPEAIWLSARGAVTIAYDVSDPQFGAAIDQVVLGMLDDGTVARFYRATFAEDPPYSVGDLVDFGSGDEG